MSNSQHRRIPPAQRPGRPRLRVGAALLAALVGGEASALTPTRTPTKTRTPTVTRTLTPTLTPTRTQTGTPTSSRTPSNTRTPSRTASPTVTATATSTRTPTLTPCPEATPEPIWVEPVTSPTDQYFQIVTVHVGNANTVTIQTESGTFRASGDFSVESPARVRVDLRPNTVHHLEVVAHVRAVSDPGGCSYPDYLLRTTVNQFGAPLLIVQSGSPRSPTPSATESPTPSASPDTPTPTRSRTATRTRTATPKPTHTEAPSPSPSPTRSGSPSPVPSVSDTVPPPSPSPTFTPEPPCTGDCNTDGRVDAAEVVRALRITLAVDAARACPLADRDGNGRTGIDELVAVVAAVSAPCGPR